MIKSFLSILILILLPFAVQAQNPIVSTVEIDNQSSNGAGFNTTELYGSSVVKLGDLDLDGVEDFATSAPAKNFSLQPDGAIFLHFMNQDGQIKRTFEIHSETPNAPNIGPNDSFSFPIASLGDLDGDGFTDLAVGGASGSSSSGQRFGKIHILFLNSDGSIKETAEIHRNTPNGPSMLEFGDGYPSSISTIGDLDGDGITELAVGAQFSNGGFVTEGAIYIHFLNDDGSLKQTLKHNSLSENGGSLSVLALYGSAVSGVGDINLDGVPDMAVGSRFGRSFGIASGITYLHLLSSNGNINRTFEFNALTPNGPDIVDDANYGHSISNMGDLDGNGVDDIAVGSPGVLETFNGDNFDSSIFIHFLNPDASIKSTIKIDNSTPNGPNYSNFDFYGTSVANIGDLDNNGIVDLAVGAPAESQLNDEGDLLGSVFIHFLNPGAPEITITGKGRTINDGDTTPRTSDGTSFDSSFLSSFEISNTGLFPLSLTGSLLVSITGANAGDFAVVKQPNPDIGNNETTSFDIRFSPTATGIRTATVSISNNDSNENPYTFAIQASSSASTDTDGDGNPNFSDPDDDNDGVSDLDELADGTNSLDSGSVIESLGNEVCVEWNGFTDFLTQIFELRNTSTSTISLNVALFDIAGVQQDLISFSLAPGIQRDVIINGMNGFIPFSFGLVCATVISGPSESLGGQLVNYRFEGGTYSLAFSSEFLPARAGNQYFTYNTFQPSLDPADGTNFVANWIQIINEENSNQSGILLYYDFVGALVRTELVTFTPGARRDIDAHIMGPFLSGLVAWEPDNPTARFRARQNRYYYGPGGLIDLVEAVSLPGKKGTGETLIKAFDSRDRTVALEFSNTLDTAVVVTTIVRDENGNPPVNQPPLIGLEPKGTRHFVLNDFLPDALGNVQITANFPNSLVVTLFEYGRAADGSLEYSNPSSPFQPLGNDLRGSYNSFLAQECRARVSSNSLIEETAEFTMTRFDGTVLLNQLRVGVPPMGAVELNLCENESTDAYGEVRLESLTSGNLSAEVIREETAGLVEFSGALRP